MQNIVHKPSPKQRWLYLLACLISGTFMLWAAVWGYAEIITITPKQNISHWEKTGIINNPQAAEAAWNNLKTASSLNNGNPEFYMDIARLATLQSVSSQLSSQEKQHYQDQTVENLKLALIKRPTWGQAWGKLAQAYADTPKQEKQFIHAFERAVILEPYRKRNQPLIVQMAIGHWTILPAPLKTILKENILKKALKHAHITTLAIDAAITNHWTVELSSIFEEDWQKNRLKKEINKRLQYDG